MEVILAGQLTGSFTVSLKSLSHVSHELPPSSCSSLDSIISSKVKVWRTIIGPDHAAHHVMSWPNDYSYLASLLRVVRSLNHKHGWGKSFLHRGSPSSVSVLIISPHSCRVIFPWYRRRLKPIGKPSPRIDNLPFILSRHQNQSAAVSNTATEWSCNKAYERPYLHSELQTRALWPKSDSGKFPSFLDTPNNCTKSSRFPLHPT